MLAAILFLLAQTAAPDGDVVTAADIEAWLDELSSPIAEIRRDAAAELLAVGDRAADALEARDFESAEARARKQELLRRIRRPRARLQLPSQVSISTRRLLVGVVVDNRRPEEVVLEPVRTTARRWTQNPRWTLAISDGRLNRSESHLRQRLVVPANREGTYWIPITLSAELGATVTIRVVYDGPDFRLDASASTYVGEDALPQIRGQLISAETPDREAALAAIRRELAVRRSTPEFRDLLLRATRSPYRDVRLGLATVIRESGRPPSRLLGETLLLLLRDRDLAVARVAARGLELFPTLGEEAARSAAKVLARRDDPRPALFERAVAGWDARARHYFLGTVLRHSRAPVVHEQVAAILRREGLIVEPKDYGLVPYSQIKALTR